MIYLFSRESDMNYEEIFRNPNEPGSSGVSTRSRRQREYEDFDVIPSTYKGSQERWNTLDKFTVMGCTTALLSTRSLGHLSDTHKFIIKDPDRLKRMVVETSGGLLMKFFKRLRPLCLSIRRHM